MTDTSTPTLQTISIKEFREAEGMHDWPVLGDGAATFFRTESLATSARFVSAVAALEGLERHQPLMDVREGGVTVRLVTRSDEAYGMSREQVDRARRITAVARELGLRPDPSVVESVGPIVIGARDVKAVMPFWRALMGYVNRPDSPDEDLVDPMDRGPGLWFEAADELSEGRNRMHLAVWLPLDRAEARVAEAVTAGGKVIFDRAAPAWWTLADPEGNEADVATTMNRD